MEYRMYLVCWCMEGLECVIDIQDLSEQDLMNALSDQPSSALSNTLHFILLRARFNSQRHYEVYTISTTPSITKEDLEQQFADCPQEIADMIRERGKCVYNGRLSTDKEFIR